MLGDSANMLNKGERMKRTIQRDITSFFTKRICAEARDTSTPNPTQSEAKKQNSSQDGELKVGALDDARLSEVDVMILPEDPGKRKRLSDFHPNDRDRVRREYIRRKPYQPENIEFPQRPCGKMLRRFSPRWFEVYRPWLEYSVEKDAVFCFACYLFKEGKTKGGDAFVREGFKTWNNTKTSLDKHVGEHTSAHNQALRKLIDFENQKM